MKVTRSCYIKSIPNDTMNNDIGLMGVF